ncbi:hypothetical protein GHK92_14565 [Nocardioides sp. dk4132]|uniref:hypothetical protein n=1 Tax=unclassified Nocardioides TaxID=2615069 RepID=UPI0012955651|nr:MULTISPECIES: hypothetical protein [unclassified Nocardioides]MQW77100.1 hypothetical protein [Nocardioides sp. dk4132]QGA05989.1 hypothetical protein GFH29_00185 [Nocardioides sp. dk884]
MTYKRRTRLAAAVAGAVMLTATAACGDDEESKDSSGESSSKSSENGFADKPMKEIQEAAIADMKALDSVRMAGTITSDGAEMSLDLRLTTSGDCAGSITSDGAEAEIIGLGQESYLKGSKEFWTQSAGPGGEKQAEALIGLIGDKWAKVPGGDFTEICDLDDFLDNLDDDESDSAEDQGEVVGETDLDGTPAIEIVSEEDGEETTVWVGSEEDKHYILKLEVVGGDEPGHFTFSEFNEPLDVQAPAKDEVVDLGAAG